MRNERMQPFATEFPIKSLDNKAAFPAEVFAWLGGMRDSKVLDATSERELENENVHLVAETGEELRMRELKSDGEWTAVGFQHDIPDRQGRLWRTEAVLRRDKDGAFVRFKTQCLARHAGAFLETPKKPYLVKALLNAEWGGVDGEIDVLDEPLWLDDSEDDITLAQAIGSGVATRWLPVVYVSATGDQEWVLTKDQIEKLAYDLGGVAHVVVEPSKRFSFRLKEASEGRNAYNGTIAIAIPSRGFIRRFYLRNEHDRVFELIENIRLGATELRSFMPSEGWDWTELQEYALRAQRNASRGAISQEEADQLLDEFTRQLKDLQDENRRLTSQLNALAVNDIADAERDISIGLDISRVVKEIYPGELLDRVRLAAQTALSVADVQGTDARTVAVWRNIMERIPRSQGVDDLLRDLTRATKDAKRMAEELTSLLLRHGFCSKSENRHIRLEAQNGFEGLANITIAKTPSEHRGLSNQRSQVERILGINKIPSNGYANK